MMLVSPCMMVLITLLNGRYFLYTPNPYYHDVIIDENRLHTIPFCREQFSVKVIEVDGNMEEDDKGTAEEQFKTSDGNLDDENFTVSGVACPLPAKDTQQELDNLIDSLLPRRGASKNILNDGSRVAQLNWDYANGDAVKELSTDGFFTMTFPTIFINGSCDFTIANLKSVKYDSLHSN